MDDATTRAIARAIADARLASSSLKPGEASVSQETLARCAYEKLQFDYPVLSSEEIVALTHEMRKEYAFGKKSDSELSMQFPVTSALVRAIVEGASGELDGVEVKASSDDVSRALQDACAVVCVDVPLFVLNSSDSVGLKALKAYAPETGGLETDGIALEHTLEASRNKSEETGGEEAHAMQVGKNGQIVNGHIDAEEDEDEDEDVWQPLETSSTSWFPPRMSNDECVVASDRVIIDMKLKGLLHELLPSRVGAKSVDSHWERSNVADSLLKLLESLCSNTEDEARYQLRTIPLRVLRERWANIPGGRFGIDTGTSRILAALDFGNVERLDDHRIALEFIAYLCLRFGADTIGGAGSLTPGHSQVVSSSRSKLWAHVNKSIPTITSSLERSICTLKTDQSDPEWQDTVGLCAFLVAFYVSNASSFVIKDVGERVVRSGCLRALVQLFIAVHLSPFAEAVRRALLFSTLACDAVFQYVSRVPDFCYALDSEAFTTRFPAHSAFWQAALRRSDAEKHVAACLTTFGDSIDDENAVRALRDALMLLHAVRRASEINGSSLFAKEGPTSSSLRVLNLTVTSVITSMTRSRDERVVDNSCTKDGEDHPQEPPIAPDVEKRREVIIDISQKLKLLLSSDVNVVVSKAD